MLSGIELNQIFMFPIKDAEARKFFLIGCVVALAGFVVPVLPYLVLFGYAMRIAKQIFNGEAPHMVAWEDGEDLFKEGAKIFGVRLIYSLPIFLFSLPLLLAGITLPIVLERVNGAQADTVMFVFLLIMLVSLLLLIPISVIIFAIIPAAEMHTASKNEFAAGFRFQEWWLIFRANLNGFLAAFAIYILASIALGFVLQLILTTLILSCLLPVLLPAVTTYLTLIMYTAAAQAYQAGKEKLTQVENAPASV